MLIYMMHDRIQVRGGGDAAIDCVTGAALHHWHGARLWHVRHVHALRGLFRPPQQHPAVRL